MISKPSFLDFFVECFKRYSWVMTISLFLYLAYIIDFSLAQQGIYLLSGDDKLGPQNVVIFNITIIMAVISGLQGFAYLHSEKKSLLYLGLPLNRIQLFLYNYMCGLLIAVLPIIVSRMICVFLLQEDQQNALYYMGTGMFVNILGFLLVYHFVILALVLTGRIWAALLGTAVVLVYGTYFLGFVIEKYCTAFFRTYYKVDIVAKLTTYLSPKELYTNLAGVLEYSPLDHWGVQGREMDLAVMLAAVILSGAAALFLFYLRPAESIGQILAFRRSWIVISIVLQVPLAMIAGYFLMSLSESGRSISFLFGGILFSVFLFNGIMERSMFLSKQLQVMGIALASVVFAAVFVYDLWNFDSFIPSPDEIESVAVSIAGFETTYFSEQDISVDYDADTRLVIMDLTEQNKVNALEWIGRIRTNDNDAAVTFASIAYKYDDGTIKYRRYALSSFAQIEEFSKVYECDEYQRGAIALAREGKVAGQSLFWSNGIERYHLDFTDEENQELLDCYHADLEALLLREVMEAGSPIGVLELTRWDEEAGVVGYIYPSFDRTLCYLQEKGFDADKLIGDYTVLKVAVKDQSGRIEYFETDTEIGEIKADLISEELLISPVLVPVSDSRVTVKCKAGDERIYLVGACKIIEK